MAVPKRRTSKRRQRMRRGANRWRKPLLQSCPDCGHVRPGHIACPACGTYNGRKVLSVQAN